MVVAVVMMLVCGGDAYAYPAAEESVNTGHLHITAEAATLFLSLYPEFDEFDTVEPRFSQFFTPLTDLTCLDLRLRIVFNRTYLELMALGVENEDEIDVVYLLCGALTTFTHFWDADRGPTNQVSFDHITGYPNAWRKASTGAALKSLWDAAIDAYNDGDKPKAYERLGHVAHLLQDQTVPAHTKEDAHGPTWFAGFLDAYEDWSKFDEDNDDLSDWYLDNGYDPRDMTLIDLPARDDILDTLEDKGWKDDVPSTRSKAELFYLMYTANQHGDYFDSWRKSGSLVCDHGLFHGSHDCFGDTNVLMFRDGTPWIDYFDGTWGASNAHVVEQVAEKSYLYAIRATATLIELFLMEVGVLPPHPGLVCPPDTTVECGSSLDPVDTGEATVLEPDVVVTYMDDDSALDPSTGLGTITRTWSATNEAGFTETCVQLITIVDTTPPTIGGPPNDMVLDATSVNGAVVTFTLPMATDLCDLNPVVVCVPPSGSLFAPGTTTVTCTATDHVGLKDSYKFTVNVRTARETIMDVKASLQAFLPTGHAMTNRLIKDACRRLEKSLDDAFWINGFTLTDFGGQEFGGVEKAVHSLQKVRPTDPAIDDAIARLVLVERILAQTALDAAVASLGNTNHFVRSQVAMQQGDDDNARGRYFQAIGWYRIAWMHAESHLRTKALHL